MNTIQLTEDHFTALSDLLLSQKSYFGMDINEFPGDLTSKRALFNYLNNYLKVDSPYYKAFGCFDETYRLLGTISCDFMQSQPTWILRRIAVSEDLKATKTSFEVMHSLMAKALEVAETYQYYQHIYLIPAKYQKAHSKIWGENDARKDRYTAVELEYVKANTPSRFRDHWEYLYGKILFPIDTVVRCSYLNPVHRKVE
jgi:hypothetical protein